MLTPMSTYFFVAVDDLPHVSVGNHWADAKAETEGEGSYSTLG